MLTTQKNTAIKLIGGYRYSFNGKEKIDEVTGSGNTIDFGARIYDCRVGRWLSRDPLTREYAWVSPYIFALNTPIQAIDPDGKRVIFPNDVAQFHGQIWLMESGLANEFRINKKGFVRKRLTPFTKNDELTKSFWKKVRAPREIYEISFSEEQKWTAATDIGSESICHYGGNGSTIIKPDWDDTGNRQPNVSVVVITKSNIALETSQFIGSILGLEEENIFREKTDLDVVDGTTLNNEYITNPDNAGSTSATEQDVNSYSIFYNSISGYTGTESRVNTYWTLIIKTSSHKEKSDCHSTSVDKNRVKARPLEIAKKLATK